MSLIIADKFKMSILFLKKYPAGRKIPLYTYCILAYTKKQHLVKKKKNIEIQY